MFILTATMATTNTTCFHVELESHSQLWHNRLGHLSYDVLKTLVFKQMVNESLRFVHTLPRWKNPMSRKSI